MTHVRLVGKVFSYFLVDGLEPLAVTAPGSRERDNDILIRVLARVR